MKEYQDLIGKIIIAIAIIILGVMITMALEAGFDQLEQAILMV